MMMMIIDFFHPKSTGRGAAENEVSCLEQVEVVAHVVHHIPGHEKDDNRVDDNNDKDDNHVDNHVDNDDLKTFFP